MPKLCWEAGISWAEPTEICKELFFRWYIISFFKEFMPVRRLFQAEFRTDPFQVTSCFSSPYVLNENVETCICFVCYTTVLHYIYSLRCAYKLFLSQFIGPFKMPMYICASLVSQHTALLSCYWTKMWMKGQLGIKVLNHHYRGQHWGLDIGRRQIKRLDVISLSITSSNSMPMRTKCVKNLCLPLC